MPRAFFLKAWVFVQETLNVSLIFKLANQASVKGNKSDFFFFFLVNNSWQLGKACSCTPL